MIGEVPAPAAIRHKRLEEIDNDLERAVFLASYRTPSQRGLRLLAVALIAARHGVRGLLYVWPLAILLLVDFSGPWEIVRLVLVALAGAAWFRFIYGSVRDDYARFVAGRLLTAARLRDVL